MYGDDCSLQWRKHNLGENLFLSHKRDRSEDKLSPMLYVESYLGFV